MLYQNKLECLLQRYEQQPSNDAVKLFYFLIDALPK
jgi:hypothetical protein